MPDLSITAIQADLRWEDKTANLRHLEGKIDAIGERTEIVILPEMFSTGFSMKADLILLDEQLNCRQVIIDGE